MHHSMYASQVGLILVDFGHSLLLPEDRPAKRSSLWKDDIENEPTGGPQCTFIVQILSNQISPIFQFFHGF